LEGLQADGFHDLLLDGIGVLDEVGVTPGRMVGMSSYKPVWSGM